MFSGTGLHHAEAGYVLAKAGGRKGQAEVMGTVSFAIWRNSL